MMIFWMMIFLKIIKILDGHQKNHHPKNHHQNHHQNRDFGYLMMSISQIWPKSKYFGGRVSTCSSQDCYFFESKCTYKTGTYLKVLLMYYFLSRVLSDLKVMGFFYSRSKSQAKSVNTNKNRALPFTAVDRNAPSAR